MAEFYNTFLIFHLVSVFLLAGVTLNALDFPHKSNGSKLAVDPGRRKTALMWSGIFALVAFVTGFGLLGIGRLDFDGWVIVKIASWLALAVMVPLIFRRVGSTFLLTVVTVSALVLAIVMVISRPF